MERGPNWKHSPIKKCPKHPLILYCKPVKTNQINNCVMRWIFCSPNMMRTERDLNFFCPFCFQTLWVVRRTSCCTSMWNSWRGCALWPAAHSNLCGGFFSSLFCKAKQKFVQREERKSKACNIFWNQLPKYPSYAAGSICHCKAGPKCLSKVFSGQGKEEKKKRKRHRKKKTVSLHGR